jgi:ABC-type multidrug transport system fused ATPase/permease subunit
VDVTDSIAFENVTFKYLKMPKESPNVLENCSFKIKAGTSTAIVGPSGSGKSTIVQMVNHFYSCAEGKITFDEHDLKEISLKSLRKSIGYVS